MVRKEVHRLAVISVAAVDHVAGTTAAPSTPKIVRSHQSVKRRISSTILPALLALTGGAFQINLPASGAPADAATTPPAITASTTTTSSDDAKNPVAPTAPSSDFSPAQPVPAGFPAAGSATVDQVQVTGDNCTLKFTDVPAKQAVAALFSSYHLSYAIDDDVSGTVNISLQDAPMLQALRSLLHANSPRLTYDYTDGVYNIHVRRGRPGRRRGRAH
jgi:hypothetical protein